MRVECTVATGDSDVRSLVNESITQPERKASYGKLILRKELKKTEEESKLMKKGNVFLRPFLPHKR